VLSDARQLEDGSVVLMPMGVARKLRYMLYVPNWSAVNAIAPMRCDQCRESKRGVHWRYWCPPGRWRLYVCEACADGYWKPGDPLPVRLEDDEFGFPVYEVNGRVV
jgi:hypothetical protein